MMSRRWSVSFTHQPTHLPGGSITLSCQDDGFKDVSGVTGTVMDATLVRAPRRGLADLLEERMAAFLLEDGDACRRHDGSRGRSLSPSALLRRAVEKIALRSRRPNVDQPAKAQLKLRITSVGG